MYMSFFAWSAKTWHCNFYILDYTSQMYYMTYEAWGRRLWPVVWNQTTKLCLELCIDMVIIM